MKTKNQKQSNFSSFSQANLRKLDLNELDPGIRRYVKIIRDIGVETIQSCQGRDNPGWHPDIDGPHHGDWPYITFDAAPADMFIALGAALKEGLPVRSIEQSWFIYPENPNVLYGPQ